MQVTALPLLVDERSLHVRLAVAPFHVFVQDPELAENLWNLVKTVAWLPLSDVFPQSDVMD